MKDAIFEPNAELPYEEI